MTERRIHKKTDGFLLIESDGLCRYLTPWESLLWRLFRRMPKCFDRWGTK